MNTKRHLHFMAFSLTSLVFANFSIRFNIGVSKISHSSHALLMENFDEIAAYERLEDIRGNQYLQYEKISQQNAFSIQLENVYVEEDRTTQPWASRTITTYLTPYEISSDAKSVQLTDATLLTGSDTDSVQTNNFTEDGLKVIAADGLSFSTDSMTKYTQGDLSDDYKPISVFIMSTESYEQLKIWRDELLDTIQLSGNNLKAQKHYQSLDCSMKVSYDFEPLHVFASIGAHYPLAIDERETIPLISYTPSGSLDASFGALFNYKYGRFGGALGLTQITGQYVFNKYQRLTAVDTDELWEEYSSSDLFDNDDVLDLGYVDYINSYSEGKDIITLPGINESSFYTELRAETLPMIQNGLSIYTTYRIAFNRESQDSDLHKLHLQQGSFSLGASFSFLDEEL